VKRLLCSYPFGDVAGHAQDCGLHDARIARRLEGDGVRVNPALPPSGPKGPKRQATRRAGHCVLMHLEIPVPVVRMDHTDHRPSDDFCEILDAEHFETGPIHVQQEAIRRHQLYAGRLGIDDGLEPTFAAFDGFLSRLPVGDVLRRAHHSRESSVIVQDHAALRAKRAHHAVGPDDPIVELEWLVVFGRFLDIPGDGINIVRVEQL
jgi:hypothetical protein